MIGQDTDVSNNPRICLVGARPDTGNHGCTALSVCATTGILQRLPNANLTIFDLGRGLRESNLSIEGKSFNYMLWGAVNSRRLYRQESFWNMRISSWFGGLWNPGVHAIAQATAVLDISSGDSFSDLYGMRRFNDDTLPKLITLQQKRPLILLPQTYGPFENPKNRRIAKYIVRNAKAAWARDEHSFAALRDLLGDSYNPEQHHSGVDLAFLLPVIKPSDTLPEPLPNWLKLDRKRPIIGFNVSGLIYDYPNAAIKDFGFRADYCRVVIDFIKKVLNETDANILLVPHVEGGGKPDREANIAVIKELKNIAGERLTLLPSGLNQSEVKWVISKCNWFCGTRMHSTIAGLSTGVPTTAIAYSIKTQGVFETCGQGSQVVDPRRLSTEEVVDALFKSFQQKEYTHKQLAQQLPAIRDRAKHQMDKIVETICK